jgi:maltose/moltooligosaccharide transporter
MNHEQITNNQQPTTENFNFLQLINMGLGFFGIQFGWALQIVNTSAIYEYLGASIEQIPFLWLAAPVSGLIIQPIAGYLSDRTWCFLGRRRPYFLIGAILSSIALVLMPNSSSLKMAVALLWLLAIAINISLSPFYAFVADLLPQQQQNRGFALQSFFIGCSSAIAALAPWWFNHILGISSDVTGDISIPSTVKLSFYLGAVIFLVTVLWTIITTPENPPEETSPIALSIKETERDFSVKFQELILFFKQMPAIMKQLAWVQFFTWLGMFCSILYFPNVVAYHVFGATQEDSSQYAQGIEWAGICIATYNIVCLIFSFFLVKLAEKLDRKIIHCICLLFGSLSLGSLFIIHNQYLILLPMICLGITWASILAIPYAILASTIPSQSMGIYMGVFNASIVVPQIIIALGLGWITIHWLGNDPLIAIVLGGLSLAIAAVLVFGIEEETDF